MDADRPRSAPECYRYRVVASTNDLLLRKAGLSVPEHTLVVAEEQSDVREGGQHWHSPRGGLWFSTLWRPNLDAESAPLLTLAATWGVREGVRRHTGIGAGIKWPNDLLVDGRKVAGVRVQGRVMDDEIDHAAIGVALNANNPVHELPEEVADEATSLQAETRRDLDLDALLEDVAAGLLEARELLEDPEELVARISRCWTQRGRPVSLDAGHTLLEGTALSIDRYGALLLDLGPRVHRVDDPALAKFVRVV